ADSAFGASTARLHDRIDGWLDEVLVDGDLQLHLAQQVHRQFMTAVDLGLALLPAEPLHIDDGQTKDLDLVEGFLDGFKFRWLDDGKNEFHDAVSAEDGSGHFHLTVKRRRGAR